MDKEHRIDIARIMTKGSASVKDWRLTKAGKRMKETAAGLKEGYFEGSLEELRERFGPEGNDQYEPDGGEPHIWAVHTDTAPRPYSRTYRKYSIKWASV